MNEHVTRRLEPFYPHAVYCTADGEVLEVGGEPVMRWTILHHCGKWTLEEANYCRSCRQLLDEPKGDPKWLPEGWVRNR